MKRIVSFFAVLMRSALAAPAQRSGADRQHSGQGVDEQGAVMPGVTITHHQPGARRRLDDRRHRRRRRQPLPVARARHLHRQGRALRASRPITRENIAVLVGQTTPVEFAMKVASVAENITVTGASPTVDTTSANVAVNLSEQLIQGTPGGRDIWGLLEAKVPGLSHEPAGRRRHVGRAAGRLQRARHDQRAEHVVPQRRQRRRSGGDRRRRLLLRLRRVRRHPGLDRRARHHRADLRRVPEHGDQDAAATSGRARTHAHVARATRRRARNDTDPTLQKYGFRPNSNTSDFVSDINVGGGGPLVQNKLRFFGIVPRLARRTRTCRCRTRRSCSTRPTSRRAWATSRGR